MKVRKGDRYRQAGTKVVFKVLKVKGSRVWVRANELEAAEEWDIERFDAKQWVKDHGSHRENFSGHTVRQTYFCKVKS